MGKPKSNKKSAAKVAAANSTKITRSGKNGRQTEIDRLMAAGKRSDVEKAAAAKEEERIQKILSSESQTAEVAAPAEAGIDDLFEQLRQESAEQQIANAEADKEAAEEAAKKAVIAETSLIKKSAKTLSSDLMNHIRIAGKSDFVRRFRELFTRDKDDAFAGVEPSRSEFLDEICKNLVSELSKSELPASWWAKWTAGISSARRWEIFRNMLGSDAASADNDRCHARISVFKGLVDKLAEETGYHKEWYRLTAADPRSMMKVLRGYAREILQASVARSLVDRVQRIIPMLDGIVAVPPAISNALWQLSCLEKAAKKKTDAVFAGKALGKWLFVNDDIHGMGIEAWLISKANSSQRIALAAKYGIGQGIRITGLAQSVFAQLGITTPEGIQSFVDETLGIRREEEPTNTDAAEPAEAAAPTEDQQLSE